MDSRTEVNKRFYGVDLAKMLGALLVVSIHHVSGIRFYNIFYLNARVNQCST